ncbi:hypothetical protein ACQKO5_04360 [Novosphingobium subterraneum]|uniref:hypothetical protein n=1 Tax=Novosphingobium subterraneum TaxID=48936 RepID=UPI003D06DC1D
MRFFVFLLAAGLVMMVLKVAVFVAVIAGIIYAIFNPREAAFWIFLCCIFALYEKYPWITGICVVGLTIFGLYLRGKEAEAEREGEAEA